MRFFVCLLDPHGRSSSDRVRRSYESLPRSRGLAFQWQSFGRMTVLTAWDDPDVDPLVADDGDHVAVGAVRLDNRSDLECWSGCKGGQLSDLQLVLHTVARHGTSHVSHFLGDFAFVVWNGRTQVAVAAVDPFAVKKLYHARRDGLFVFGSRAEALALDDAYDVQYLAERVAICSPTPELTVYSGVKCIPPATVAVLESGRLSIQPYWSPDDFEAEATWASSEYEAVETCRQLLTDSVRLRLGNNGDTWAQLSGGTDSSSVVSIAQWLVERGALRHGLAGTVTYADREGTATDEREYSDAVAARWQLRNETIINPAFWLDDNWPPPQTDFPRFSLPFYPRERHLCTVVRGAGGRVLLTGVGGDELFTGTMLFFADWMARGHVWPALREMARRAAIGRVSFWKLAYLNSLLPLLPRAVQHRLMREEGQMPSWMPEGVARRYRLRDRTYAILSYSGRIGHKYHDAIAAHVVAIGTGLDFGTVIEDVLDLRHPFLYRPLVEFALRLPPELLVRPNARKWVLREALSGIVPDIVRMRIGKGSPAEVYAWSLTGRRALLEPLVREPILADLGVVDSAKLRAAFDAAPQQPHRRDQWHSVLQFTLTIEAWLQMRSGRWPRGRDLSNTH